MSLTRSPELFRHALACQLQRAPDRLNHIRIEDCIGMSGVKAIVKNLTHECGTTEHTAGHGHRNSATSRKQAPDDDSSQTRQMMGPLG